MIPGIGKSQLVVGSAPTCDIVVQGPGVGAQHLSLSMQGNTLAVGMLQPLVQAAPQFGGSLPAAAQQAPMPGPSLPMAAHAPPPMSPQPPVAQPPMPPPQAPTAQAPDVNRSHGKARTMIGEAI